MIISAIVAVGKRNVIGVGNALPWHLPSDLKHFKEVTTGQPVIMGDKTHESIGMVLPGRTNIVISNNPGYQVKEGAVLTGNLNEAIGRAEETGAAEAFIIGGAYTYAQALPLCGKLYVTQVEADLPAGDKFFPEIDLGEWELIESRPGEKTEKDEYDFTFQLYKRK